MSHQTLHGTPLPPTGGGLGSGVAAPHWAWIPKDGEVFAAADPGTCRPMMCDPVVDDDTRAPGVIEPLHVMETDEKGFGDEPHVPFRLPGDEAGVGHSSSPSDTVIHGTPTSSTAVPVLKDSTRHAFEVRLRADWVGSRRVSFGTEGTPRESGAGPSNEFSFATPAGGFGSPFGAPPQTQFTGGSVSSASDGSPVGLGNTALGDKAASAKSCGSVGLVSIFTGKYLQARRKRPHRLQFFGDKRGVYETWEVIGGARSKLRRWRAWGALAGDGVDDGGAIKTTIGSASASASASSAASSRFMGGDDMRAALVDLFERDVPFERLGSRDVLVVRSKQSPRRCLLLVRLTLATGEPVVSQSPGKSGPSESGLGSLAHRTRRRSSPTPRRSEGSIRFTMHDDSPSEVRSRRESRTQSVGSVSGRESQGEVTASLDALDVMQLSNKLLAGFARGRGETRRAQRQAYFAWKAHTRETVHAQARAEMMGTLYEKKWRQRLLTAWERRTSERRAKRWNQERMNLRVRQWRARWTWRRCTLGFVRWRLLARKAATAGEFLERFARRWMHSVASRSFARWRVYVSDTARMRVAARRVVRRMRSVKLSAAFDRWSESAGDSRSARRKLYSAATALRKTHVRRAFRQWSDATETTRRRGHAERRADVLFVRSTRAFKSDAFVSWANFATAKRISRYRFEKVSARWRRLETVRPLRAWREQARHVRTIRAHMRSTYLADLKHLERGAVRRAMAWWRLWTESTRRTRLDAEAKQHTELRLLQVVANRMRRFVAASAFERWREVIRAVRAERRAVKFVRGLLNRRLATAFAGWRDSADRRISAREKIAFVVTRMTASLLARAFTTWASATEKAWARRVKGERAERFLLRMMNARAASAFSRWKECVEDSRKRVHFLSGHERARSLKAQNRALRVMSAWKGYTTHKAIGRSTCEMAHKMLRKKRMEVFLKTWRLETHWKDTVERRRLVSICQRRCGRREMNRRFAHWRTYRGRTRRQRLAIARLLHAKTYAAFSRWRDHANDQRAFLRRMEKVMRRWLRLSLSYPFERWCESVDERKRLRGVLERCTLRMGNRCTSAAFARWSETVVRRREWGAAERRAEHLCRRMVRAAAASAFDGWIDAVKRNASKRETAHRLLIRWQNLHAAHYFDTWADAVETSRERRVLFRKTVVRIRNVKLNAAWNAWTDAKTGGRRLRRIARRLRDLRSSQTLSSWRQICERRNAARATLRRCERFMHRVLTVKSRVAFVAWLDTFRHRRTGRRLAFIASIRSRRADLERRFKRWAAPVKNKKGLNLYVVSRAVTMQRTRAMKVQCFAEWTRVVDGRGVRDDKSAVMRARHAIRRAMVRWRFVTDTNKERGVKIKFALRRWRGRAVGECFRAWVDITRVRKRSLRFFARLTRRSQLAAFNAWATNASGAKRKRYNLQKVVIRWRRLRLAAPFQDWIDWMDDVRVNRATMNKVLRRARRVVSYAAFNTWREAVGSIRRDRALIGRAERVVRRLVARDASRALVSWRDFVWKRRKLRGLLERWRRQDLSVAFRTWMEAADEAAGSRATLLVVVINKMLKRRQSAAFNQWLHATWQGKARAGNLRKMHKFARRMADRTSAAAFSAWLEYAIHRAATRMSIQRIAARWMRLTLAVPFNAWCDWTDEVKSARLKVAKFLHRMKTVYSTRAFYAWVDTWLERRRVRHSMSRAERYFKRLASQSVAKVFNTWAENVVDNRRRRYALEKIITRWQRLQLAAPFSDWVEWVDEVRGNRTKLRKFVHRMRTAKSAAAFATWRDAWSESRRRRRLMSRTERFFRRIAMRSTSAAFNAWVHRAAVTKSHRYKLAKVVTRWRRLQLSTPFDDWVQWVNTLTANRAILRRVVHRMRRVKIASAFAAWIDAADSSRAENARLSKMKRVARRFANRTVASAFTALAEHAREVKRLRRSAAAVARRWRRLALSIPFDDWRDAIAGAYRERLILVRFVHRMRTVVANAAFQRWCDFLVDEAATRAIERRAQIMARRWTQKSAAAAFAGWVDAAAARVDVRRALARHVRKWRRVDISYPFITWRDKIAENRRMVGSMERAKRFFGGRVLKNDRARAFQTWKLHYTFVCRVREAEDKEETETRRKNQARVRAQRMVRRWTLRTIAAAFDAWAGFTRERRRLKTSIRKATRRWRLLHVSVPFHDWAAHVEDIRRERLVLGKSVQRMERFQLLAPFQRWQDAVYVRRSERGALLRAERFFTRLLRADTHRAFNAWIGHVHTARRVRLELGRVVARWRRAKLAAAFECWRVYYERCEANRAILRKAGARLRSHRVGPAFDTWHANWREGQRTRAALGRARRFVLRVARATLARGFRAFVGHAAERRRLFDALAIVAARWRSRTTSAAFQTWSDRTCEVKAHRATVTKIARRMSRVRLAAAVGKWRDEVSFGRDAWAREKLATRALLRMARRQLAAAFDRLRANCEDAKRGRELLARCRARWGNRALSAAFRTWRLETNRASLERSTLRKAIHRMRTVRVARSFETWRATWHITRALARAWDRCERVFKRRRVAKVRAALNAWYLFSAKARRETLQRQADELMFLQGSLGSERHQKEKVSQELHRTRRESEGLAVLIERLQRETGVLLDQVAERDAQISRLLEERDRSAATRRNDRLSAILASPPRKQRTPPRPPSPEPEPTPVSTSIEIQEADPESPESPERSDADSEEEDVSRELFPTNDDTPPPSRHLPDAIEPHSRPKLTKAAPSHPSHDPGYYAAAAADWASGRRSPPRDDLSVRLFARVRPFVDGDADKTRSLRPSRPGASDLDVVTRRGEVPFRRTFEFDGGVFWEDDDEVRAASAAAACLADATRRGRDATMLVVGSDKGGKTHVADAVVAACAAFLDLHAFRANERAAAKAEKFEAEKLKAEKSLDTKRRESRADESSEPPFVETRVSMSVYQTRGLHADDLLAGFGGATGLRVKPGAEYAEAGVGNDESSRHGGLLYEVEELTRVDCADLTDVREMLALARTRRDGHAHRAEATATIAELWVTTSETRVNPGLNPDGTPGSKRTVNRRCVRVVDVRGGDASASTATTPLFNLSQLTRGLAADTNGAAPPDWRRSALTKIMKGPLTGTGTLSVFVATAGSEAHAVDALGALHLAAAAKRLPGRDASHDRGEDRGAPVRVVVERPELSRRERLERTLALARTTARATVVSEGLGEMTTPPGRRRAAERRAIEMSMDAQLTPEHVVSGLSPGDASPRTPGRSFRPGLRSASKR